MPMSREERQRRMVEEAEAAIAAIQPALPDGYEAVRKYRRGYLTRVLIRPKIRKGARAEGSVGNGPEPSM